MIHPPEGNYASIEELIAASAATAAADQPVAEPFVSQTQPPKISWGVNGNPDLDIAASYIEAIDVVQLTAYNSNPLLTNLSAQVRVLLPDGSIQTSELTINQLTHDRTPNVAQMSQIEGFILAVVVGPPSVASGSGQTYATVDIVRGAAPTLLTVQRLVAAYVTSGFLPYWPGGSLESATDGPGAFLTYFVTAPAAGATPNIFQPTGTVWRVIAGTSNLNTSATVINRSVFLDITVPSLGTDVYRVQSTNLQPASKGFVYSFGDSVDYGNGASVCTFPIPRDLRIVGAELSLEALNLQAADQFGGFSVQVEEWIDV
jgi:hypothetical protein